MKYCDEADAADCLTGSVADCQNYCRQSFGSQCPAAKETFYACVLVENAVCSLAEVCESEYENFVELGCLGGS